MLVEIKSITEAGLKKRRQLQTNEKQALKHRIAAALFLKLSDVFFGLINFCF